LIRDSGEKAAAMPQGTEATALWRAKAEEARTLAEQATDPQVRLAMLKIAESYEHLAAIAERSAAATKLVDN
jgi:hypothetical protein